jgi:hypothetical protein
MNRLLTFTLLATLLALAACGCGAQVSGESIATVKTAAQLDSAISRSNLPGARVVGGAMRVTGRAAHRSSSLDSLQY